jgi:hypothetical protein
MFEFSDALEALRQQSLQRGWYVIFGTWSQAGSLIGKLLTYATRHCLQEQRDPLGPSDNALNGLVLKAATGSGAGQKLAKSLLSRREYEMKTFSFSIEPSGMQITADRYERTPMYPNRSPRDRRSPNVGGWRLALEETP